MQGGPAIAANPREASRLLLFWVKIPNTSSEIGTTLSRARACGSPRQAKCTALYASKDGKGRAMPAGQCVTLYPFYPFHLLL